MKLFIKEEQTTISESSSSSSSKNSQPFSNTSQFLNNNLNSQILKEAPDPDFFLSSSSLTPENLQTSQFMDLKSINPVLKSFLIGSVSGTCSTILFQPLDLLKTRLQAPITHIGNSGNHGMVSIVRHIVRDEKFLGLFKGMTPSLSRCVPGVGIYFASIHSFKMIFNIQGELNATQSVLLGISGRSISGIIMIPFTVVKTRFESRVYQYQSISGALKSIYRQEGLRGLSCGLLPTLLRDSPFSGLYLLLYTTTKKSVPKESLESELYGPFVRFSCAIVSGIGASLLTQPADVIKTKMQLFPDKFNNVSDVIRYVYAKYGVKGYFKGIIPRCVRRTLVASMSWTIYEQLMRNVGLK